MHLVKWIYLNYRSAVKWYSIRNKCCCFHLRSTRWAHGKENRLCWRSIELFEKTDCSTSYIQVIQENERWVSNRRSIFCGFFFMFRIMSLLRFAASKTQTNYRKRFKKKSKAKNSKVIDRQKAKNREWNGDFMAILIFHHVKYEEIITFNWHSVLHTLMKI